MDIAVHRTPTEYDPLLHDSVQHVTSHRLSNSCLFEAGAPLVLAPEEKEELLIASLSGFSKSYSEKKKNILKDFLVPFTLMMSAIGAGTLSIPYTFVLLPVWQAVLVLFFAAFGMAFTADVLIRVHVIMALKPGHNNLRETYPHLANCAGGVPLERLISFLAGFAVFGACVGCIRVVKDMIPTIVSLGYDFLGDNFHHLTKERQEIFAIYTLWTIFLLIVLPLACCQKISALRFFSYMGCIFVLYLVWAVSYRSFHLDNVTIENDVNVTEDVSSSGFLSYLWRLSQCFAIYNFTFMIHLNVIPLFSHIIGDGVGGRAYMKAEKKMQYHIYGVIFICALLYTTFGICAASIYRNKTEGNILLNLNNDPIMLVPRIAIVFTILFSFPLLFHPLRSLVMELFCFEKSSSLGVQLATSIVLLLGQIICAIRVPGVQVVFSFVGSSMLLFLCYLLPGICYWKLYPWQDTKKTRMQCALLIGIIFLASLFCIIATIDVFQKTVLTTST
jgi:amino acid permease